MENHNLLVETYRSFFANEELYFVENKQENSVINVPQTIAKEVDTVIKIESVKIVEPIKEVIHNNKIIPLLIVVDEETETVKVFLEKILKAVNLSLDQVELINNETLKHTSFIEIAKEKTFQRILSFGVPLVKLNLSIMLLPYQNKQIEGVWFLLVEKLVVIENDIAHKRQLWGCLQELFKV